MAYTKEDLFYLGVTDLQSARKKIVDISLLPLFVKYISTFFVV